MADTPAQRQARYRKKHPEKIKAYTEKSKETRKEYFSNYRKKPETKERLKFWEEENKEKVKKMQKERYLKNKYEVIANVAKWQKENPDKVKEAGKRHRAKNKDKELQRNREWKLKNPDKYLARRKKYESENRAYLNAKETKRRAHKFTATPKWANEFFIEEIYDLANIRSKLTGFKWEVDHMVPLKSKFVCGLHVEHNLAVIPATVNRKKHNSYWPDMP